MVGVVERDGTGEGVLEHVRAATRRREVFSMCTKIAKLLEKVKRRVRKPTKGDG